MASPRPVVRLRGGGYLASDTSLNALTDLDADLQLRDVNGKPRNNTQDWLTRNERLVPIAILFIAGFTRFYRLDRPDGVACACGRVFLSASE